MSQDLIHKELSESIIGAAMKVLNTLKPGLDEKLYERALAIELRKRGHRVDSQRQFPVHYEGEHIGTLVPDMIVDDLVIADPKVVSGFNENHIAQMIGYLNITGLKLAEIHRRHLGTQLRDADREVTLHRGGLPEADSVSLAAHLLGQLTTPSQAAIKAETRLIVQDALNNMDPTDREVLALKHFEQLSTSEIAEVLGMSKAGAGSRYLRAIKRLKEILSQIPGFMEGQ